jgi:hypothetical protein
MNVVTSIRVGRLRLIQEEIKSTLNYGNALLTFSPEPSVLSSAVEKLENLNIQEYS